MEQSPARIISGAVNIDGQWWGGINKRQAMEKGECLYILGQKGEGGGICEEAQHTSSSLSARA